jgi:putative transposase
MIALDPGIRTFMYGYTPTGQEVKIGDQNVQRLCGLSHYIDKLSQRITICTGRRKRSLKKARLKVYTRIRNLVNELHWKSANYLCKNFDIILLPSFGTSDMVRKFHGKRRRKISKNTRRKMLMFSHYRFKLRLLQKAKEHGKNVVIVNESYTSKTCGRCGSIHHELGDKKVFKCPVCHFQTDRDLNGARNILLRNII